MEDGGIALRDILLAVAGLAGIYLAVMVLRLVRMSRRTSAKTDGEAVEPALDAPAAREPDEDTVYFMPTARPQHAEQPADFSAELARSHQDGEIRRLREEVAQLREEVGQLRGELADMKAARNVSPQYSDAMALAQRGLTAQDVADRCGISLGEAELVWALARRPNFEEDEDYGGEPGFKH